MTRKSSNKSMNITQRTSTSMHIQELQQQPDIGNYEQVIISTTSVSPQSHHKVNMQNFTEHSQSKATLMNESLQQSVDIQSNLENQNYSNDQIVTEQQNLNVHHVPSPQSILGPYSPIAIGPTRVNGFQLPFSIDQISSWIAHTLSAAMFYIVCFILLSHIGANVVVTICVIVHMCTTVLLVVAWISCERIDPSKPVSETLPNGWMCIKLGGPRWEKTRYCAVCRKSVVGLDHHCSWLQTCVGVSNYAQFFTIACTGLVQFLTQTILSVYSIVWIWHTSALPISDSSASDDNILETIKFPESFSAILFATFFISMPCLIIYTILLSFHITLMFYGYGTYEWMLRRRKAQRAKAMTQTLAKKEKEKEKELRMLAESTPNRSDSSSSDESADAEGLSSPSSPQNHPFQIKSGEVTAV